MHFTDCRVPQPQPQPLSTIISTTPPPDVVTEKQILKLKIKKKISAAPVTPVEKQKLKIKIVKRKPSLNEEEEPTNKIKIKITIKKQTGYKKKTF